MCVCDRVEEKQTTPYYNTNTNLWTALTSLGSFATFSRSSLKNDPSELGVGTGSPVDVRQLRVSSSSTQLAKSAWQEKEKRQHHASYGSTCMTKTQENHVGKTTAQELVRARWLTEIRDGHLSDLIDISARAWWISNTVMLPSYLMDLYVSSGGFPRPASKYETKNVIYVISLSVFQHTGWTKNGNSQCLFHTLRESNSGKQKK